MKTQDWNIGGGRMLTALPARIGASLLLFFVGTTVYLQFLSRSSPTSQSISHHPNAKASYSRLSYDAPPTIIRSGDHDEYLAVCLFVRDQRRDLPEFLQHHYHNIGIRRFYILDDGSTPPLSNFAATFGIPEEAIDFIYENRTAGPHARAQVDRLHDCGKVWAVNNTWVAFIDTDEFLWLHENESLESMLRQLTETRPEVGALGVNWMIHTSSNVRYRAPSCREAFLECIWDDPEQNGMSSDNKHIKSIVRADSFGTMINPHKFNLLHDRITVGEKGDEVTHFAFRQPITRDRIGLHHYAVKSWEEFEEKLSRSTKDWWFWNHVEYDQPHQACPEMLRYTSKDHE
ncbi:hypothetical protein ANO11243_063520 [Dothideomycetidae sp. 11243]|nr:hypothetical protein ANO11243_063520 [fungal sp. No.11243]